MGRFYSCFNTKTLEADADSFCTLSLKTFWNIPSYGFLLTLLAFQLLRRFQKFFYYNFATLVYFTHNCFTVSDKLIWMTNFWCVHQNDVLSWYFHVQHVIQTATKKIESEQILKLYSFKDLQFLAAIEDSFALPAWPRGGDCIQAILFIWLHFHS